jgi:hypothetical protein
VKDTQAGAADERSKQRKYNVVNSKSAVNGGEEEGDNRFEEG